MRTFISFILIILSVTGHLNAQFNDLRIKAGLETYLSTDSILPFWMRSNKYGKIPDHSLVQLAEMSISSRDNIITGKLMLDYGLDLVYTWAGKSDVKVQEYYARLKYKPFILRIGAVEDSLRYNGLSSTNGNIIYSNNYRPLPGIEFATNGWAPVPLTHGYFKIKL